MDYSLKEDLVDKVFNQFKILVIPFEGNNYCPKFLYSKIALYFVVFLLILKVLVTGISLNIPKNFFFADITENALVNYVNEGRKAAGLAPLAESSKLDEAAYLKAEDMLSNGYFYHVSPSGVTPWHWFNEAGYEYKYAGENLAIGFFESEEVYQAWMDSNTHKDNIMSPYYKEVGTAVVKGIFNGNTATIVVQLFGTSLEKTQKPVATTQTTKTQAPETPKTEPTTQTATQVVTEAQPVKSRVLSSFSIKKLDTTKEAQLYLRVLNYLVYNSEEFIKYICYILLTLVGISMFFLAFVESNKQMQGVVMRAALFVVLISAAAFVDKHLLSYLIQHEIRI